MSYLRIVRYWQGRDQGEELVETKSCYFPRHATFRRKYLLNEKKLSSPTNRTAEKIHLTLEVWQMWIEIM